MNLQESGCFDPQYSMTHWHALMVMGGLSSPDGTTTQTHDILEDNLNLSSYNHHQLEEEDASTAVQMEIQRHHLLDTTTTNSHFIPPELSYEQSNRDAADHQSFNMLLSSSSPKAAYPPTPDLLNLFHLPPKCSFLPNSSISFESASASSVVCDPLFHLNLTPQPPVFRELLQSLPHGYTLPADEKELYHDGDNGILEFTRDISMVAHSKGRDKAGKTTKHFATERERRVHLNDKFQALRTMVPSPTKNDRASIVGDAIDYIKELLRTVRELKLVVEKKRCGQDRSKRLKTEETATAADAGDGECKLLGLGDPDQCYNTCLRSSWLQRKSKNSEVDVRVIDDEVTIKLVQRKKINCLLFVSRLLDELQLDLHHVAGGNIGDYYSFLFNTKIYEGSSVYASAIANNLINVVDKQDAAAAPPTSSTCL
ncbi:hypothetical protein ES319_A05G352200v1 [Gossypium barbadense]|uniref:BHLH domain-containing protein n=2 Tax=Gossypium TaxID=3633 RepID=A0A5J5VY35_GOSBA|nr:hypothetical protein ES319_A05G352200v1 [Gossypium barbadense]TYH19688.1 hypothetical protein ES288_A05G371700v1 [Gossypium darwinii]